MNLELIKQDGSDYKKVLEGGSHIGNIFKFRDLDSGKDKGNIKCYSTHRIELRDENFNETPTQADVTKAKELIELSLNAMPTAPEPDPETVTTTEGGTL